MSSSTPRLRFLLDENVRIELTEFLRSHALDVKRLPKGTSDALLAAVSKRGRLILVTNDKDFSLYPSGKIFAVVWLKIPQREVATLPALFQKLLRECSRFSGRLVVLSRDGWKSFSLPRPRKIAM